MPKMKLLWFEDLAENQHPSPNVLKQTFQQYASGGWAVKPDEVKSIIDRAKLKEKDIVDLVEIAKLGLAKQRSLKGERYTSIFHAYAYENIIRHLNRLRVVH